MHEEVQFNMFDILWDVAPSDHLMKIRTFVYDSYVQTHEDPYFSLTIYLMRPAVIWFYIGLLKDRISCPGHFSTS